MVKKYKSETEKIRPVIQHYLDKANLILDIGCGDDKVCNNSLGIDLRKLSGVDYVFPDKESVYQLDQLFHTKFDIVYSSHLLEHLLEPKRAIDNWLSILKPGGYLILYLPDTRYYKDMGGDVGNLEHMHSFTYEVFMRWFRGLFGDKVEIVFNNPHMDEECYSFCLVVRLK